jgi:hypothetical protein
MVLVVAGCLTSGVLIGRMASELIYRQEIQSSISLRFWLNYAASLGRYESVWGSLS